ncbi:MAG: tocopherol cyclase family protein [Anaerolineales bacterium]
MFSNILHPSRYHGRGVSPPFFEGWYYKMVSQDEETRFVIIPGVYHATEESKSHCFVQVFDSQADQVHFHRYPFNAFRSKRDSFEIYVGDNYFSADQIRLAIDDDLAHVHGSLKFSNLNPWPVQFFSPGAMGWFAWVPFMECYHGVVSMDHTIEGSLDFDGKTLNFTSGRGYIEKDWGRQFPAAWIWGQSNHFDKPGISLMISLATIPWLGGSFGGHVIGLLLDGTLHRFATYNRSKIDEIAIKDSEICLVVHNRSLRLSISAKRKRGVILQAPTTIEMDRRILETLDARLDIQVESLQGGLIYEGPGHHAGLEAVGDLNELIGKVI